MWFLGTTLGDGYVGSEHDGVFGSHPDAVGRDVAEVDVAGTMLRVRAGFGTMPSDAIDELARASKKCGYAEGDLPPLDRSRIGNELPITS